MIDAETRDPGLRCPGRARAVRRPVLGASVAGRQPAAIVSEARPTMGGPFVAALGSVRPVDGVDRPVTSEPNAHG